jgi:adenine-specific DNA-methyltransferase
MDKYIGNKRVLLPAIFAFASEHCSDSTSLCDIFAGTTNVGRFFRNRGYQVISNDINRFSFVLGMTYLGLRTYPQFSRLRLSALPTRRTQEQMKAAFLSAAARDRGDFLPTDNVNDIWAGMERAIQVVGFLNELEPGRRLQGFIRNYYTVAGRKSRFESVRGTTGKRNYFSDSNAKKLDCILEQVRLWWLDGELTEEELYFLLTSILEEVVITSNVNGTFHDFNRNKLWPNALQTLFLRLPLVSPLRRGATVYCQDARTIVPYVAPHDILYIDPPYNFRQYTAYYHFLNFVAAYPFLSCVQSYLDDIAFVRGQNMSDDFTSEFSFRDQFIDSLQNLVASTSARYVIMSYYGARNHWNHWSQVDSRGDIGFEMLQDVFSNDALFTSACSTTVLQLRQNYQSRVGERKTLVDEYLFFGQRRRKPTRIKKAGPDVLLSRLNTHFGLHAFQPKQQTRRVCT